MEQVRRNYPFHVDNNFSSFRIVSNIITNSYCVFATDFNFKYDESIKEVSNAMKENLGIKKAKVVKSFSFDANTPYEKAVIGQKATGKKSLTLLPSFVGQTLSYAQSWCSSHGIKVSVNGGNGYVLSQSAPAGANIEDVRSITLTAGGTSSSSKETTNKEEENETCDDANAHYDKNSKKCVCNSGYELKSGKCETETEPEPETPETPETPENPE